jgi:NDP-sugar pyrophosphorylase family protein
MAPTTPRAMILAAGFGTRLGELTRLRPKPMLPICGAPLVRWAVLWLRHHGVREIVINLHHLGEQIREELGDGSGLGVSIAYSPESVILGTGGGLREARHLLDDGSGAPIVVLNGKVLHELDLGALLAFHREREVEATMVLRRDDESVWGGSLGADAAGRLVRLLGEMAPNVQSDSIPDLMFTGIHVMEPQFLDRVPLEGEQCIIRTAYMEAFRSGRVGAMVTDRYWWEHSTPERYIAGVRNVLDGHVDLPFAEGPLAGVDPTAKVAADAAIAGPVWIGPNVEIGARSQVGPYVQLGAGARVGPGIRLERSIVWEGVEVRRSATDEVLVSDA